LGWVPLKGRDLRRENFSCDARGHWFFNIVVEGTEVPARPVHSALGIDLGLKDFAAFSNGEKIENPHYLRQLAGGLATAQRARKSKSRPAKSVLDAGWSSFRNMLRYKAAAHGAWYEEVNESFSTRVCSSCGGETGPKGAAELGIRSWICAECGMSHDRDINSAQNILFGSGHRTPAVGIPAL
jgi:putative transposase